MSIPFAQCNGAVTDASISLVQFVIYALNLIFVDLSFTME